MKKAVILYCLATVLLASCSQPIKTMNIQTDIKQINNEVYGVENAFAKTMAERDFIGFAKFIADDAVFFAGDKALRGKAAVLQAWEANYQGEKAPFSWQAEVVEAHASGNLVLSNGPVYNAKGELIARFNSIWQKQTDGSWQVIFDKGTSMADLQQHQ